MAKQLFGTDGIRGVAGEYPLDDATVLAAGRSLGNLVAGLDPHPEVLIGMDTRQSGLRLAQLLAGGLMQAGVPSCFAGVIPTPGLAYLTQKGRFVAGVMISASHNPYQDNGIKVFAHSGFKLPDEQEEKVEEGIRRWMGEPSRLSELKTDSTLAEKYIDHLVSCWEAPPKPRVKLVVDCANGASYRVAPPLLE